MATLNQRIGSDGKMVYRVRIRRKGYATQTATFSKLSEAKKWAQITEGAIFEGRHFNVKEAKRHTVTDLIDRYLQEILPHKSQSSIYMQTLQLKWWKSQLGHCVLADLTPAIIAEYPYNDICLDVLIFLIYGASKDTDYPKQEAADVTGESHTRRGVHHPSV
jgi:hypothetical protein